VRNHGVLSKAQRALEIAGWSPEAQQDAEIFRLVDTGSLTPLLMVLNDAKGNGAQHLAETPRVNGPASNGVRALPAPRASSNPRSI
jgi:hypothetical protein